MSACDPNTCAASPTPSVAGNASASASPAPRPQSTLHRRRRTTSALDVSIQAQTLNLLQDLQDEFSLSYLFIAHDLSVVEHISDSVAVMYVGKIVEQADTRRLYHNPKHPYTEALLSSIPRPRSRNPKTPRTHPRRMPNPADPPTGCYFHPRCPYAEAICSQEEPPLQEVAPGHVAACHFSDQLTLRGVNDF